MPKGLFRQQTTQSKDKGYITNNEIYFPRAFVGPAVLFAGCEYEIINESYFQALHAPLR